jgi:uncharacterized protein (TIGR03437 family)
MRALIFLVFAALPLYAQIDVDTFAGGSVPSGVPANSVYLGTVTGITYDPAGHVVYCDTNHNLIRRINEDGTVETIAGTGVAGFNGDGGAALETELNQPAFPKYDGAGNLYFVDQFNYRIRRIDTRGLVSTLAGDGIPFQPGMDTSGPPSSRSLDVLRAFTVDPAGNVYFIGLMDGSSTYKVRRITPGGDSAVIFTGLVSMTSYSLAADGVGNVYLSQDLGGNAGFGSIARITSSGQVTAFAQGSAKFGSSFLEIAADAAGDVFAVVPGGIVRYGADESVTLVAGGSNGRLSSPDGPATPSVLTPRDVAADSNGDVAFVDDFRYQYTDRNEIREVTGGQLKTLAAADPKAAPDGTLASQAWFLSPSSIAVSKSGDLYIADYWACQIREIPAGGMLTTFAGSGVCGTAEPTGNAKNVNLIYPVSIAVDSQNRVWVADYYGYFYSIDPDGTMSKPVSTPVTGGKGLLAVDSKDRLYVLGSASLRRVLADGTVQSIANPVVAPVGIGEGADGAVYFSNIAGPPQGYYRVNDDGTTTYIASNSVLRYGTTLAVDAAGSVWDGETTNNFGGGATVDVTNSAGTAQLGLFAAGYSGDGGPAQSAGFARIQTISLSPSGDLYVLDGDRVRLITGLGKPAPAPVIGSGGVVNAFSYSGGGVVPGELVTIFGSGFGAAGVVENQPVNNSFPPVLGRVKVLFGTQPCAITAVTPGQINVVAPQSFFSNQTTIPVRVQVDATLSAAVSVPVVGAAPGLATVGATGTGQGAILNEDGSVNSPAHPAPRGSVISLFGTGEGLDSMQLPSGALVISTPYPFAEQTVDVTIGGQPAEVLYAGSAPTLVQGVLQINVRVPDQATAGTVPVGLTIGGVESTQSVTVPVQ